MEKFVDYTYAAMMGFLAILLFIGLIGNIKRAEYRNSPEYISKITKNCEDVAKEKTTVFSQSSNKKTQRKMIFATSQKTTTAIQISEFQSSTDLLKKTFSMK